MTVLELFIVIVLILWLAGWLAVPAIGNLAHVLLVVLLVLLLVRVIQGRRL
jgi:hypothetical protein